VSGSGGTAHALLEATQPARWLLLVALGGVVASALTCALLCDVTHLVTRSVSGHLTEKMQEEYTSVWAPLQRTAIDALMQAPPRFAPPKPGFTDESSSGRRDSNPRPQAWEACALPTELLPRGGRTLAPSAPPQKTKLERLTRA
jgi:hypothetical protein